MPVDTRRDIPPIYNETLKSFSRDVVPRFSALNVSRVEPIVQARLELEQQTLVCGIAPRSKGFELHEAHFAVLAKMLAEVDSPSSVRFRAQAAAMVGHYEIRAAIPMLREIALDEDDDLQTRLNAIPSFVKLVGDGAYGVIEKLLESPIGAIRTVTYIVALEDRECRMARLALERLKREADRTVYAAVLRRAAVLQEQYATIDAPSAPVPPGQDLSGCFPMFFGNRWTRRAYYRNRKGG